jgi:hypothetical protein
MVPKSLILLFLLSFGSIAGNAQPWGVPAAQDAIDEVHAAHASTELSPESTGYAWQPDSLKKRAYEKKWTRELYNIVVIPTSRAVSDTITTAQGFNLYSGFEGLRVRTVRFTKLNPFGTDLNDTGFHSINWLSKTGNALHIRTMDRVLERHLLFREGDLISSDILADNERLLRGLSFIEDVRIVVTPLDSLPGYADVDILTKDTWSKAFFLELNDLESGKFDIWDRNIFGTGNEVQASLHWDPAKSDFYGVEAFYRARNIFGSFIDSRINYQNVFENQSIGMVFDRKYFTPNTKYAGSLSANTTRTERNIRIDDSTTLSSPVHFNTTDFWVGRAIGLPTNVILGPGRLNLFLASRFYNYSYSERPATSREFLYEYHNRSVWLNSLTVSNQSFFRSNLIYNFGRTEDIPTGWMAGISYGREFSEYAGRNYGSFQLSLANYLYSLGYLYLSASAGGFINDYSEIQQGLVNLEMDYFTNLFLFGRFKMRHFGSLNYLRGINRFDPEIININDKRGLTGFSKNDINGQQKIVLNLELVCYTPGDIMGFRTVLYAFADQALLGSQNTSLSEMNLYSAVGAGLRIRNENLVFPTLQFRFAWYPGVDGMKAAEYFKLSGETRYLPKNFSPGAPGLLDYQ